MPYKNRVIIIDDKIEDGNLISTKLREEVITSYFFHYEESKLLNLISKDKKFSGIRIIFQDIQLIAGNAAPDHRDFGAAAASINALLHEENGPWLMVAWSTWADGSDDGSAYAKNLFDYLQRTLPEGKRPFHYFVINKSLFTVDGQHREVKPEAQLSVDENEYLVNRIHEAFRACGALSSLVQWEFDTQQCVSETTYNLWRLVKEAIPPNANIEVINQGLTDLLFTLAKGRDNRVDRNDISKPLYQTLSGILLDKLHNLPPGSISAEGQKKLLQFDGAKLNTFFHWEPLSISKMNPGNVYLYPDDVSMLPLPCIKNKLEYIGDFFMLQGKKASALKDGGCMQKLQLILIDITPLCDHSNGKAILRKMLIGVKFADEVRDKYFCDSEGKYLNESFIFSPKLKEEDGEFCLMLNSKLFISLPDNQSLFNCFTLIGRVREELLGQIVSTFSQKISRVGILEFR